MQKIKRFYKLIVASVIALIFVFIMLFSLPNKILAAENDSYISYTNSKTDNLLDSANLFQGTTLGDSGLPIIEPNNYSRVVSKDFIFVNPNTSYCIKSYKDGLHIFEVNFYDKNKSVIALNTINDIEYQFTTPENCYYIILLFRMNDNSYIHINDVVCNVMFNVGNEFKSYTPFISNNYLKTYDEGFLDGLNKSKKLNGIWNYIDYLYVYTEEVNSYTFNDLLSGNYLVGYSLNLYSLSLIDNENYSSCSFSFYFTENIPITEFDLFFASASDGFITLYDENDYIIEIRLQTLKNGICNFNILKEIDSNFGSFISYIEIDYSSPDPIDSILNNSSYADGYSTGYNYGYSVAKDSYFDSGYDEGYNDGLNDIINNDSHFNEGYDEGYDDAYDYAYSKGYSEGKEYGFDKSGDLASMPKNFLNAMFSTPINIFKSLLNWEFFGINLFGVLTSLLTIAVVVFLFRKFKK